MSGETWNEITYKAAEAYLGGGAPSPTNPNANPATGRSGQVKIAVTGTAVRVTASATPLVNGVIFSALTTNTALAGGICGTAGTASNLTNVADGTGNGYILLPGGGGSLGVSDLSALYFNGVAGDIFSYFAS